ncbi:septin and tuftelin-interacting protein 1 homolog 1-like [Lolium rigidum]|uniref:septin and tuftelin-interacting protein 1 homolog 1-like n=1 Tax=Lolium rigidum TaxID=89674 RepID=UPI001F5D6B6F|nr:septin and tuftelin-interacting protein 1 homolog 1-like [Lolium rigidum]
MALLASTSPAVAKMLLRWNFKEGSGLGARGQGIVAPVQLCNTTTGIGYGERSYENGLPGTTPAVQEEWRRRCEELARALRLEEVCCFKTLELLLRDMTRYDDARSRAETAEALAAIVKSMKMFQLKRTPGMWKATLPSSTVLYIVERVIKPKMAADAQEWTPSWDADCHQWVRPWIPLVGHLPDGLFDAVERKITNHADEYAVISPWKDYMDQTQWDTFTRRHVLPWLTSLVRELMIAPPKQMDPSFHTLMQWAPLVPAKTVVSILEEELFFDRFEDALRHWLQSGAGKPSAKEAVAWCTGWKNLFTPDLLADEGVLARMDAIADLVDAEA